MAGFVKQRRPGRERKSLPPGTLTRDFQRLYTLCSVQLSLSLSTHASGCPARLKLQPFLRLIATITPFTEAVSLSPTSTHSWYEYT